MILGLRLKNWKSFRDEVVFSSYASGIKQNKDHISVVSKNKIRVLPVGMIFGGNASGKSNFVSAISFLKQYVTNPFFARMQLLNTPFLFSKHTANAPSEIEIQLLSDEIVYNFTIRFDRTKVYQERLSVVKRTGENVLYEREGDRFTFSKKFTGEELARLKFAAQGTKPGQLFLSNSIDQNVTTFSSVYDWFNKKLVVLTPDYALDAAVFLKAPDLAKVFGRELSLFDTGIERIELSPTKISDLGLPSEITDQIYSLLEDQESSAHYAINGKYLVFSKDGEKLVANRIFAQHLDEDADEIPLAFEFESDGTRRLFDLIPAFAMLAHPEIQKVVVIDELDRSLHTKLSQNMIQSFLSGRTPESRSQLIFTTHDMMILDQSKFRRDEIWIVEKNETGASEMICLSDFNIRYDLDIRKAYLDGRFETHPYLQHIGG